MTLNGFKSRLKAFVLKSKLGRFENLSFQSLGKNISVMSPFLIKNPQYISIGNNFSALYNLRIEAWDSYAGKNFTPQIKIGDNVSFNSDVHIGCIDKVEIGNNVLVASRIFIADCFHGNISSDALSLPPSQRPLFSKGPVIIEDNVWIGEGVCILHGVRIGKNSIIGANTVVNKDIPPNSVVGGIPCRILKTL